MREQQKANTHACMQITYLAASYVLSVEALEVVPVWCSRGRRSVGGERLCCSAVLLLMMLDVPP